MLIENAWEQLPLDLQLPADPSSTVCDVCGKKFRTASAHLHEDGIYRCGWCAARRERNLKKGGNENDAQEI